MTIFALQANKVHAFDISERDTSGFSIFMQLGPLVFEWWVSARSPSRRNPSQGVPVFYFAIAVAFVLGYLLCAVNVF